MLQLEPIPPFEKVDKSSKAIGGPIEESGDDDDDDDDDDDVVDVHASEFPPAVNLNPEDDSGNKDEEVKSLIIILSVKNRDLTRYKRSYSCICHE